MSLYTLYSHHRAQTGPGTPVPNSPFNLTGSGVYLSIPLVSQAFGALPIDNGVAVKDGVIQVDSSALTGTLDGGTYVS